VTRLDLTDCTAIITGASRGIGLAVAQAISVAGGNVVLTSRRQESVDAAAARFTKTFDVNLWAPILWTSLATRAWMGEHGGVVVNTASIGGMGFEANLGLYNASKAALIHLTKQLALELSPKVRVNAVAPGVVRTKLAAALWKEQQSPAG
jgi:NAD(P)-dependent dehydrogenase (short-subunit alcohol dehydrogenase family)